MKRIKSALLIAVVVLVVVGVTIWMSSANQQPKIGPMEASELVLTKAWNGEIVRVPGLLTVPQWMKETRDYKRILRRGFVTNLSWTDLEGNKYVAHALGREKDKAGNRFVCFSSMEKKRPDGSLENATLLAGDREPFECKIMDEKGNKIIFVSKGNNGGYNVAFFENNEDKFVKEWEIDPELNIYSEQVRGEDGHYHFTHNMRENR